MPAPLNVDKEAVRVLVVAVGPREAARQMGIPEGTVQDWSAKGKWLADTRPTPAKLPPPASMVGPTSPTKPAEALANVMATTKDRYLIGAAKAVANAAEHAAKLDPESALDASGKLRDVVMAGHKLHGLDREREQSVRVNIYAQNALIQESEGPVIDV